MGAYVTHKKELLKVSTGCLLHGFHAFILQLQRNHNSICSSGYEYVLLTKYTKTMKIGDEYYLTAITSTGKKPKFSSSDSAVASVNTYGKITAKKAGNATITAKIANGEASCRVTS